MAVQLSAFPVEYQANPLKQIVTTSEKFERMIRWLKSRKRIVVDYETSGIAWFQHATYCGVGLASWDDQGRVWNAYVPVRHHTNTPQLSAELIAPAIKDLLEDASIEKVGHNIKFEDHFSRKEGWRIKGSRYDTMVASRLYDDNAPLKLGKRAELHLGVKDAMAWNVALNAEVAKLAHANGMGIEDYKWRYGYSEVDPVLCGIYCCTDTDHTAKLRDFYEAWGVSRHYPRIWPTEMRLTEVLCDMEQNGMPVDVPYLESVRGQVRASKESLEGRIQQLMGGYKFNLGSDDELRSTLYHVLGLRWDKRTKGNQLAVDREVLESFSDSIEVCKLILKWRDAEKIDSTYTTSIIELLDSNNVLHGNLKSVGTNCMPAGELVLTSRGYLPVESVAVGDAVLTHTGKKQRVTRALLNGLQPIVCVTLENGLSLRTTLNHAYWNGEFWTEAQYLRCGDSVQIHSVAPEEWRTIPDWPGFQVSSWGRVWNVNTKRIVTQWPEGRWGHLKVCLVRNQSRIRGPDRRDFSVHRLVASVFDLPGEGPEIRHLNGIAWDNTVWNLKWGTSTENRRDAVAHGTMSRRGSKQAKLNDAKVRFILCTSRLQMSDYVMGKFLGCSRELVRDIRLGKRWLPVESKYGPLSMFRSAKVQSINFEGERSTYGLEVAEDHSHVTGGIVTHNTGRLSCSEPSYQNISTDDEDRALVFSGKKLKEGGKDPWSIRRAFIVPNSSMCRILLDYSQIELRMLAYYSHDPILVETYLTGGDVHERTAREIGAKLGIEAIPRRVAKVINFGLCLPGHQRVLTNKGLMRLDQVTTGHLLWDGIAWVAHDGLICRGEQDVIEFGGIEATPDHAVFTEDGGKVPLGDLASAVYPRRFAVGAIGDAPQLYNSRVDREGGDAWALTGSGSSMQRLQEGALDLCRCYSGETRGLPLPVGQVQGSPSPFIGSALRRYGAALRAGYARFLRELQGARNPGVLSIARAFYSLGLGGIPGNGLQGSGLRSDQQRRALRAWQHAARVAFLQSLESSEAWWRVLQAWASALWGQSICASSGAACLPGLYAPVRPSVPRPPTRRAVVYDLLNAGPRHRFTVSGKIVSNSYCMSEKGVAASTKIPVEEAALFLQAFFQRYGGISSYRQELWAKARRDGCQWSNIFGRTRRLPDLMATEFWKRKRAERQMIGSAIQGTAAELTKESLVRISNWLAAEKIPALLVNTVHDEIQIDCPRECLIQVVKGCKRLMEDFPEFQPIPIIAEPAVTFTSWADKVPYKEESDHG